MYVAILYTYICISKLNMNMDHSAKFAIHQITTTNTKALHST